MIGVEKKVKDTVFFYSGGYLDEPSDYYIKRKGKLIERFDYLIKEKEIFLEQKTNKQGDIIYAVVELEYVPSENDVKYLSEIEIAKKQLEKKKIKIIENEIEYY